MSPNTFYPDRWVFLMKIISTLHFLWLGWNKKNRWNVTCLIYTDIHLFAVLIQQLSCPLPEPSLTWAHPVRTHMAWLAETSLLISPPSSMSVFFFSFSPLLNPSKWLGGMWVRTVWCSVFMAQGFIRLSAGPWARLNVQAALLVLQTCC